MCNKENLLNSGSAKQHGRLVTAIFLLAWAILLGLRWKLGLDFKFFGFYDPGAALKANWLAAQGLVPTVDFAYSYGLLSLEISRAWFRGWELVFGNNAQHWWSTESGGYQVFSAVGTFLIVLGISQLARIWRWGVMAIVLALLALPMAIHEVYLNPTHVMEAVLLVFGFVLQAKRRWKWALVLATLCLFIKPSMAYFYGLLLLVWILQQYRWGKNWRPLFKTLAPAMVVGGLTLGYLLLRYGPTPVVHTLIPLDAGKSYQAAHFGFFRGDGQRFWLRPVNEYFTTIAGFWLLSTSLMLVILARRMIHHMRLGRGLVASILGHGTGQVEVILLHFFFICALYAWKDSWKYYSYIFVIGVAQTLHILWSEILGFKQVRRLITGVIVAMAAIGQIRDVGWWQQTWSWQSRPELGGLYAEDSLLRELAQVRQLAQDRPTLWLMNGALLRIVPDISSPQIGDLECWWLSPALPKEREMADIRQRWQQAQVVVRFGELSGNLDPWNWDEFAVERAAFDPASEHKTGRWFVVEFRSPNRR